jgi:peptidyl-prolyl cis-trans isomerase SurA
MVRVLLFVAAFVMAAAPVAAQRGGQVLERAAAVVNDEAISLTDLQSREKLILLSTGLPDTPETRERIRPQVIRGLVDEALQRQEARRANLVVSAEDVQRGVASIAGQNRMSIDQLRRMLDQNGIPLSTMENQVRANIAWLRLVQRRFGPASQVGEEDVDAALRQLEENVGKPEYLVAEIYLSVDRPEQEGEVRALADRLYEQMRQGSASFPQVARQFSQSAGAAGGGDLGWIQQGQLAQELDEVLATIQPGQVSRPTRSAGGWHILFLRDRRIAGYGQPSGTEFSWRQVVIPAPRQLGAFELLDLAQKETDLIGRINGCESVDAAARTAGATAEAVQTAMDGQVPAALSRLLGGLRPGRATMAERSARGSLIVVLCERREIAATKPTREQIEQTLVNERIELAARRLLRDLRRAAFVDIRI